MNKKILVVFMAVMMCFALVSCGGADNGIKDVGTKVIDDIKHSVAKMIQGNINGEVGKVYATQWFQFVIESIEAVDSYAGYAPEDGYILVDVFISEKGTFADEESSPMGTFDFYMDSDTFSDYIYPLDPFDGTMMPLEFDLARDEIVSYHMVYEIPEGVTDLKLMYTEVNVESSKGATFVIKIGAL